MIQEVLTINIMLGCCCCCPVHSLSSFYSDPFFLLSVCQIESNHYAECLLSFFFLCLKAVFVCLFLFSASVYFDCWTAHITFKCHSKLFNSFFSIQHLCTCYLNRNSIVEHSSKMAYHSITKKLSFHSVKYYIRLFHSSAFAN